VQGACDCSPLSLTSGPDGNLWFAGEGAGPSGNGGIPGGVGSIDPGSGDITRFATPTPISGIGGTLDGITAGPDGNLWFTETNVNQIGQVALNAVLKTAVSSRDPKT
jgi:virginiamycin B lyase